MFFVACSAYDIVDGLNGVAGDPNDVAGGAYGVTVGPNGVADVAGDAHAKLMLRGGRSRRAIEPT